MFAQVLNCSSSYFRQINPINNKNKNKKSHNYRKSGSFIPSNNGNSGSIT
jgi:hypothetical protein